MTVETPPSGTPSLAASGRRLDSPGADTAWLRALTDLTSELRSCGLEARMDGVIGAVDATAYGPARRTERAVLRPHRGRLWWWLRWTGDPATTAPHRAPLTPAADPAAAARRIMGVLGPARTEG
ncbi:hypothetical protein [Nocardiopsis trehalosi]|jgi:hypothetical protein|uniref:hypothetical protein n=1 Tax=Nocardiopsis trehalosi TaxID=109329 RepID=UPI000AA8A248|nr:hypothetical protein [Nocardiopsis trehalosi]